MKATDTEKLLFDMYHVIAALKFYESMSDVHNCNDCGQPQKCMYRPKWGEPVRWNCPHWKEVGK